jgi:hypothetical protein
MLYESTPRSDSSNSYSSVQYGGVDQRSCLDFGVPDRVYDEYTRVDCLCTCVHKASVRFLPYGTVRLYQTG